MPNPRSVQAHILAVQVANALAKLKAAYEERHEIPKFDVIVQAHMHCQRIAGLDSEFGAEIDELEDFEEAYERETGEFFLPRWRARRQFMQGIIDSGRVRNPQAIERVAQFMAMIDDILKVDEDEPDEDGSEHDNMLVFNLLHAVIISSSWSQFQAGHLRDAVLNAVVALGDLLREGTGLNLDGKPLVESALSINRPRLIFSTLETESGRNDQIGFMNILSGFFIGVRNPKAHSLQHDLNPSKVGQYLVVASLLARRIAEAHHVEQPET